MTERMTVDDVDGITDEGRDERLDRNTETRASNRQDFTLNDEEFQAEEEEGEEDAVEAAMVGEDVYGRDEYLVWGEEPRREDEHERERGREETEEEEAEVATPPATIPAAEKSEEEARDAAGPDHALAEIPVEIFASREAMIGKLKELVAEQTELRRRNKLLEQWIVRHTKKMQEKATPTDTTTTTTTTARDPEEMERIYRQTLCAYKLRLDEVTERRARTTADLQSHEDRACELRDENARTFDELLGREREVATGLVYATTGRKIAGKAVDEITRRQVSRREALARDRYGCIVLQHRLEKACAWLRDLETLGEGRTAMDYEALRTAHASHRDKLDERDRELEKLRHKIAETVNGLAHHKEKEACLAEDIALEQRELDVRRGEAVRVREDVNRLHLILRDLRRAHDERRLGAGLLMAQPVLREMERTMKSLDALRNDIEIIKREIQRYGPAYGKGRGKDAQRGEASSTMTQDKPGRS